MKRVWRGVGRFVRGAVWAAIAVELLSFILVSAVNVIMTGKIREMSQVVLYSPYCIYHNRNGLRHTTGPQEAPAVRHKLVWMFGGSTMRGEPGNDAVTISSQTSALLNSATNGCPFVIRNCGEHAYNSLLEMGYYSELLVKTNERPDMVLFYDGANDTAHFCLYRNADAHYAYDRVRSIVEGYSRTLLGLLKPVNAAWLASFTRELYGKIVFVAGAIDERDPVLASFVDQCERRYDHINRLAGAYGSTFILAWQPYLWIQEEGGPSDARAWASIHHRSLSVVRRNYRTVNRALRARLAGKPYFVDLHDVLERAPSREPLYTPDGVHLTAEGSRIVATKIAAILEPGLTGPDRGVDR